MENRFFFLIPKVSFQNFLSLYWHYLLQSFFTFNKGRIRNLSPKKTSSSQLHSIQSNPLPGFGFVGNNILNTDKGY